LPEGMSASASFIFITDKDLPMPALCKSENRLRWLLKDKQVQLYKLMAKTQSGCMYRYVCELFCEPSC